MLGVELASPCAELVKRALDKGLLINVAHEKVVRLLPPLILTDAEADTVVDEVVALIHGLEAP
jgi:acetylornithine aminotransferase